MNKRIAQNIMALLLETNIQGRQVPVFAEAMMALEQIIKAEAPGKKKEPGKETGLEGDKDTETPKTD